MEIIGIPDHKQGGPYTLMLTAINSAGSSDDYVFPNIGEVFLTFTVL